MACLILRALILISMRLVGAQIWIPGRLIGAWIVQRDLEIREEKVTPCNQVFSYTQIGSNSS
jgi:hypothetical protein